MAFLMDIQSGIQKERTKALWTALLWVLRMDNKMVFPKVPQMALELVSWKAEQSVFQKDLQKGLTKVYQRVLPVESEKAYWKGHRWGCSNLNHWCPPACQ